MKSFAALLIVAAFVVSSQAGLTEEQIAKLKQYNKECVDSSGTDQAVVNKARKGEFTDDPKLKDFFGCMFKKVGFMNDAGEIQIDVIKSKMPADYSKEEAEKVFAACKDKKGSNPSETAFEAFKCYWETTPNHISIA